MISYIILVIFVISFIKCFQQTFITIIILYSFLNQFIVPGIPLSLFDVLSLIALVIYILKFGINYNQFKSCPVALSLLLICFSYIISNYYAVYKHYPTLIKDIVIILNIFIFYSIIKKSPQRYIPYFVRVCYVFGGVIAFYALFEAITRTNPYIQFVNNMDIYSQKFYITEVRFGLKRCQSLFSMHGTLGAVALILGCFLLYVRINTNILKSNRITAIVIILLFLAVLLTGARSAILGMVICLIMFLKKRYIKTKYIILFLCVIGIFCFVFSGYIGSIYESFIDTEKVGGSNKDMREMQFDIVLYFFNQSLWVGNGLAYTFEYVKTNFPDEILGAESLWFPIMIDQGIIGVSAYVIFVISCFSFIIKYKKFSLLFFLFGLLMFNSMSSIPNFNFIYIVIYLYVMVSSLHVYAHDKFNELS